LSAPAAAETPAARGGTLRVLLLAPQPFFEVRGTPLAVLSLVRALVALGHHVDLLSYPQGEAVRLPRLRHFRSLPLPVGRVRPGPSWAKLALDVPFLFEAALRMALGGYDVVHAVEEAAHLAAPLARLLGLPLVVDMDSSIPDQLRESGFARGGPLLWAASALERHALRHAAAVVTVCASLTERVKTRAPAARVFQIEDPPLPEATPDAAAAAALRTELGLGRDPVVLYSGNFEPYQGVELLVDAAALVAEAQFVFMGGEAGEVEALRARSAASARTTFAGRRPPAELPAFLALADVLVSPRCRGDNTPFKLFTYLASGKPVVATRLPTHTQLLDDSCAVLVEPSAQGLAAGIRQVLADPAAAEARAARGRSLIESRFSAERYVEKVRAAYASVAS
jgi:glycosyltransferase involved in cell wall biosynthesis